MYNLIHLPEYHYCIVSYQHTPRSAVAAFNISFCYFLEISCLDNHNNKTVTLYAHLTTAQISSAPTCQLILKTLHNAFIDAGGNATTASVCLVGGCYNILKRNTQRGFISQGLTHLGYTQITMPHGHWMRSPQQSIDYLFSANTVLYRHLIDPKDASQDQHTPSLNNVQKELFFDILYCMYHQTSSSIFDAISVRQQGIINLQACLKRDSVFSKSATLALWDFMQPTLATSEMQHTKKLSSAAISLLTTHRSLVNPAIDSQLSYKH